MILAGKRAVLAVLLLVSFCGREVWSQKAPVLPELSTKRLLNDLQVIFASTPHLGDSMIIGVVLRYGAIFDPVDKGGLANMVCRMLFRGAIDRTRKDLQDELSVLGASVDVRCEWDGIRILLRGQSARVERSLLLLYQAVGEAVFTENDFAEVKNELLEQVRRPEDPRLRTRLKFEQAIFGGTSYARPITGTPASLQKISIGDVRLFYRRYFSPGAAALVIAGSAPPQQVLQKASRIWGVWVRREDIPFTFLQPRKPAARTVYAEDDPGSPAAQFILGSLWPQRGDPSYYTSMLAARILQERLTRALPTSLLTVAAEGRRMPGPFFIQGQAAADQVVGEIRRVLETVDEMKAAPPAEAELTEVRKNWVGEFRRSLESVEGVCSIIMDSELYRLGTNYAASFPGILELCDPQAVQAAAKEWILPGGVVILVRGPMAALQSQLETLGVVRPAPQ
ncbi:MAG: insulinase family protein [Acidobacteria bacterium]|nr:insulinase family protein [Acidobacteriota bacterium]